jgi:hypothetical protein
MRTPTPTLSRLAALLIVAAPAAALAQPAPPGPPGPPATAQAQPGPPAPPMTQVSAQSQMQAATEQRISGLQAELAITPEEMPQWTAFAQVMRDNAQTTDMLFRQRAAGVQSMNAVANMQSYAQISRAYADGTAKLAASFDTLYGALSVPQKQAADTLFMQQARHDTKPPPKR